MTVVPSMGVVEYGSSVLHFAGTDDMAKCGAGKLVQHCMPVNPSDTICKQCVAAIAEADPRRAHRRDRRRVHRTRPGQQQPQ